jgi:hypothetical protein
MFRLVLIHHLVVSLLVGPWLCCCTTAQVGLQNAFGGPLKTGSTTQRKSCCGEPLKSDQKGGHKSSDGSHHGPHKCPCKDGKTQVATAPEVSVDTTSLLNLLSVWVTLPLTHGILDNASLVLRSSHLQDFGRLALTTDDLLYAHHNLRC